MIHEFFTVTQTSVYKVTDEKDEKSCPLVEKMALKGESAIPIGGRLKGGYHVGIMFKAGIVLFPSSESYREPELVNIQSHGSKTSSIIALFLSKDEAVACLNSKNLQSCDARWKEETLETLNEIGGIHPVFIPSVTDGPSYRHY